MDAYGGGNLDQKDHTDCPRGGLVPLMVVHTCHWPGCGKAVPPKLWGCLEHWRRLPKYLRERIWATYRPGQEVDKQPSREYLAAARAVQEWIQLQEQ